MVRFRVGHRSRRPMGPGGRIISGLIGCAIFAFVSFSTFEDYSQADTLGTRGQKIDGQVINVREHRGSRKSSSTDYYVTAAFTLPDGTVVRGEREVSEACYYRFSSATQSTPISATFLYDPANTGNWHPAEDLGNKQSTAGWMLVLFPALALGALGLAAWGVYGLAKGKSAASQYPQHGYPPGAPQPYPQQGYPPGPNQPYPQQGYPPGPPQQYPPQSPPQRYPGQ